MEDLKVVGWVDFDSSYPTKNYTKEETLEVLRIIKRNIADNEYRFSGEEHQYGRNGAPLLSDGTCFRASMRLFGMIMASVYNYLENKKYTYMDFYMSLDNSSMPKDETIELEPNLNVDTTVGYALTEDYQVMGEALSFGMDFMTTDKVLKELFKIIKENN